jgi:hypothetical protein
MPTRTTSLSVYRRQIVEIIADDMRDGYRQMLGISATGAISHLKVPHLPGGQVFRGGGFDLSAIQLDRDTAISPEVLLIRDARWVSGVRVPELEDIRGASIPTVIQDPWHRTPKHNLWTLLKLMELPPAQMGSLTGAVLRATARALLWTSAARSECFATIGEMAMEHLAQIANAKGHAPNIWLISQSTNFRQAIQISGEPSDDPAITMSAKTVTEVVRQQAAGIRPPSAHTGGRPSSSGAGGNSHGYGGAGSGQYNGGGRPSGRQGLAAQTFQDNRVADGDLHALVASLRSELPRDEGIDQENDASYEQFIEDENSYQLDESTSNQVDPDELAAFESIDAIPSAISPGSGNRPVPNTTTKFHKKKSSPNMGNVSFGSGKRRPKDGPRVR